MGTKRYVMIGAPVTRVRTPPLLKAMLANHGVEAEIETRHVEPGDLAVTVSGIEADTSVDGLLVTMPHKKAILPTLEAVSTTARLVGSVNAVKRAASGRFVGGQFDGVALVNALLAKGVPVATARIFLLGLGGAGLAIAHAIAGHGCQALVIADQDGRLVDAALESLRRDVAARAPAAAGLGRTRFDLLINATPLGMRDGDPSPFAEDLAARTPWIADIVADPSRTSLAALAGRAGATLISGRDMVQEQIEPICRWLLGRNLEQGP